MKNTSWFTQKKDHILIYAYIRPNNKKSEIVDIFNSFLRIKIQAPSDKGRANEELLTFLAKITNEPKKIFLYYLEKNKKKKQ